METGSEVLMILKTTARRVGALERLIIAQHPYQVPEFIVFGLRRANKRYSEWWDSSVT